jgi:hypothetical protein
MCCIANRISRSAGAKKFFGYGFYKHFVPLGLKSGREIPGICLCSSRDRLSHVNLAGDGGGDQGGAVFLQPLDRLFNLLH